MCHKEDWGKRRGLNDSLVDGQVSMVSMIFNDFNDFNGGRRVKRTKLLVLGLINKHTLRVDAPGSCLSSFAYFRSVGEPNRCFGEGETEPLDCMEGDLGKAATTCWSGDE